MFYFMLVTSQTCENFRHSLQHYWGNIYFNVVSIFSNIFFPPLIKSIYSHPSETFSPFSAATGSRQAAVPHHWRNGVLIGFFFEDQTGDNLMVQGEDWCRKSVHRQFVMASMVHTSTVMEEKHFRHFSCRINSTKVRIRLLSVSMQWLESCCPPRQEVHKNTSFSSWKIVIKIFSAYSTLFTFFFLGDVVWCHSITGTWIWVQNAFIPHDNLQQEALTSNCCIGANKQWQFAFLILLGASISTGGTPTTTDLGIDEIFNTCHYTAFTDEWDGAHFICYYAEVTNYHFIPPVDVERHQCTAIQSLHSFSVKCCSSCFSSFNPYYPSSDSTHIHRRFTIHSEQPFVNACWLVTFNFELSTACQSLSF